ncbi:MAG: cell division topological specificity factor MinE [Halochromatium sp.]|uniref:cell division topological specificity factor MinE n=1 Tax=Halochromatium sp. TaxID=2049430 RepID=UPI00397E4B51
MGLIDYFRSNSESGKGSASVAKERLRILVAHDRAARDRPFYLPKLQEEIVAVIRKYVAVDNDAVSVSYEQEDSQEILEVNIILPETPSQS